MRYGAVRYGMVRSSARGAVLRGAVHRSAVQYSPVQYGALPLRMVRKRIVVSDIDPILIKFSLIYHFFIRYLRESPSQRSGKSYRAQEDQGG